jgi:hypothetical protein
MRKFAPLLFVLLLASCHPVRGFLESEFNLSPDSPLPAWYPKLPDGYKREDVTIRMQYYTPLFHVDDTVFIVESGWWRTLYKGTGKSEHHPKYWAWAQKDWPARANPGYVNVTIDGKTEIIEHKKMEPIFHISNEEAVKQTMGAEY